MCRTRGLERGGRGGGRSESGETPSLATHPRNRSQSWVWRPEGDVVSSGPREELSSRRHRWEGTRNRPPPSPLLRPHLPLEDPTTHAPGIPPAGQRRAVVNLEKDQHDESVQRTVSV